LLIKSSFDFWVFNAYDLSASIGLPGRGLTLLISLCAQSKAEESNFVSFAGNIR
jgi:hypothetical protein